MSMSIAIHNENSKCFISVPLSLIKLLKPMHSWSIKQNDNVTSSPETILRVHVYNV